MTNWSPTPKAQWVKKGDTCVSPAGMRGKVLNVTTPRNLLPSATVRWENGHTGRLTITNLRRDDAPHCAVCGNPRHFPALSEFCADWHTR